MDSLLKSKAKRFIVCSDIHGDMRDEEACASLIEFTNDFNPDIRVIAGDLFDFRNLRKGANDDEKAASLVDDWEAGTDFGNKFFKGGRENVFMLGNHDTRLWDFSRSATGILRDFAYDGISKMQGYAKRWNSKLLPYDSAKGIYHIGYLKVVHGYFAGANATQQHARVYGNVIHGHTHDIAVCAIPSLEPKEARSIGCLCKKDMDYCNAKTAKLRWSHGWAYGFLFESGEYVLNQARSINGQFHVCKEISTY